MEFCYLDELIIITLHVTGFLHPAIFLYFHHSSDKLSDLKVTDCTVQSAEYWCFYGMCIECMGVDTQDSFLYAGMTHCAFHLEFGKKVNPPSLRQ